MMEFLDNKVLIIVISILIIYGIRKKIINFFSKCVETIIKILINNIIPLLIKTLSRFKINLEKCNEVENLYKLEDLTPHLTKIQKEKNKEIQFAYLNSLEYGIKNKNVVNIALTGGFGTGKSTLINEFIENYGGYKYLRISLANFNNDETDEKLIETSILQQIIYFENKTKLKESSYNRIIFTKSRHKIVASIFILIWFYSVFALYFPGLVFEIPFLEKKDLDISILSMLIKYNDVIKFIFTSGVFIIVYEAYDKIKNLKLSKISSKDFEIINKGNEVNLSVFNRNIEEIIYFFEKSKTEIVIIEDIDRFKEQTAKKIFSKIRELSTLIKESKSINQPVKFIYAVKDELLTSEKTKFFDFIIPVLPITDYSNSENIFLDKLKEFIEQDNQQKQEVAIDNTNVENNNDVVNQVEQIDEVAKKSYLDKEFISEVSNYIPDMRTIINICNEFKIYHEIQKTNKSITNENKLFALILYKNLFSEDFAKIKTGNSNLHKIFDRRHKSYFSEYLKKNITKRLSEKIIEKEEEIDQEKEKLDKNILMDIKELRKVYLFNIIEKIIKRKHLLSKIEKFEINDLIENEANFSEIIKSNNISYQYSSYSNYSNENLGLSFKNIEQEINSELKFSQREQIIKDFHNHKIAKLNKELIELKRDKNEIEYSKIQKLLSIYTTEIELFIKSFYETKMKDDNDLAEVKESDSNISLILNLIRNGFLTEDFTNYVSYFHEGSLSTNDQNLLMRIIDDKPTKFDEKIDVVANLVKKINVLHFKNNDKLIIVDILKELLNESQDKEKRNPRLDDFLSQIRNFKESSVEFLEIFINKILNEEKNDEIFSSFINEIVEWDDFWFLVSKSFKDEKLKKQILFFLIEHFQNNLTGNLNKNKSVANYINNYADFLIDINHNMLVTPAMTIITDLEIEFESIKYDKKIKVILDTVYEKELYKINISNFKLLAEFDKKYTYNELSFNETNYSFLSSKKDSYLYKRIENNFDDYFKNVYLELEEESKEESSTIQTLLESDKFKDKAIKLYIIIKGFIGNIKSISKIKDYYVAKLLFDINKIECSWTTIIDFTDFEAVDYYDFDVIIDFINKNENYKTLSMKDFFNEYQEHFDSERVFYDFIYKIINSSKLSKECFESIFDDSNDLKLDSTEIIFDKENTDADVRILHLMEKNYLELNKKEFDNLKNVDWAKPSLIKLIEKKENDFMKDLSSYNFDIDFLESLINSSISENNKIELIHQKEYLIIDEDNRNHKLIDNIKNLYLKNDFSDFSEDLFNVLLNSTFEVVEKIKFFNFYAQKNNLADLEIDKVLGNIGGDFLSLRNKEKVLLEKNEVNNEFLEILKKQGYISNFNKTKNKETFNIIYNS